MYIVRAPYYLPSVVALFGHQSSSFRSIHIFTIRSFVVLDVCCMWIQPCCICSGRLLKSQCGLWRNAAVFAEVVFFRDACDDFLKGTCINPELQLAFFSRCVSPLHFPWFSSVYPLLYLYFHLCCCRRLCRRLLHSLNLTGFFLAKVWSAFCRFNYGLEHFSPLCFSFFPCSSMCCVFWLCCYFFRFSSSLPSHPLIAIWTHSHVLDTHGVLRKNLLKARVLSCCCMCSPSTSGRLCRVVLGWTAVSWILIPSLDCFCSWLVSGCRSSFDFCL